MDHPRIAIWRAVSTDEQAKEGKESLDYQHRLNLEHVARWGGVVVADLLVDGESRNIILWQDACDKLQAFADLDKLIKRKPDERPDILMCYDLTRLARTAALATTVCALLEQAGIRLYETTAPPYSLDGPITTPDSRLVMLFKSHQSEQEVRKFAERAGFGRQAQVRKGKHANTPPLGLKRTFALVEDKLETITVIDDEWRPLVELFYQLYLEHGRTQFQIVKEFNARGYLTPEGLPWDRESIRVFLRNRWAYAGYTTWGHRSKSPDKAFRLQAEWQPIISEDAAREAERAAKERASKPKAAGRPGRFSMMLKCKQCNATLSVTKYPPTSKERKTGYICRFRCKKSFVRETLVADALARAITYLQDQARLDELVGETPAEQTDYEEMLAESKKALEGVGKERKKLTQAFMREAIELEEYEPLMTELKERQDAIALNITEIQNQIAAKPTPARRRQRLEQIRDSGLELLRHPDVATANAWLRQRFTVHIENNKVATILLY